MKPETVFRKRILEKLKEFKNTVIFPIQQQSIRGTPDLILCVSGIFVAIELKAYFGANVSSLQKYNLDKIDKAGGLAIVMYPENSEPILKALKELDNVHEAET